MYTKIHRIFKKIFTPSSSIQKRTLQGTFWLFSLRIIDQLFNFIKIIILAHILSPADFGLFGVAFITISVVDSLSQTGFAQALIQRQGPIEPYLDTAWTIQIIRGILLMVILMLLAPLIASMFGVPEATLILRIAALAMLIQGFVNIGVVHFQKELQLHKYFIYQIVGLVVDFALVVTTALIFSNVWALVIGFIVGDLMRLILSYVLHRYRPHFYFDVKKAKELFRFGKWIFGSNAVSFLLLQGDSIFVGKLLNIVSLGFYQMSSKVSSITGAEVLGGAIFPAYSKIQHDKEKMRQAYIKTLKLLLFVLAPIAAGIIAVAPEFTQLFLGSQWLPSVPAMRVLTLAGFLWAFAVVTVPVFSAIGKPHIETNYNILRLVVLFALLYPFIKLWGIVGASCAVLAGVLICVAGMSISAIIILNCKWGVYVKTIAIPVINSALMLSFVVVIKSFIDVNRLSFFLIVLYGVISYGVLVFLSEKLLRYHMLAVIKENIKLLLA